MSKNFRESFLFSVRRLCRRRRKVVRESSNAKGRNGGQEEKAGACATIAKVDTRIMIFKGMFYKSKYSILAKNKSNQRAFRVLNSID